MIRALGRGLILKQAGHELGISVESAKTYARRAREKLGAETAAEAVILHESVHRRCAKLVTLRSDLSPPM